MTVACCDLLAGDDQEILAGQRPPHPMGGRRVVVSADHEVQPGRAGTGGHFLRRPVPVGVDRVEVSIPAVPPPRPAGELLRRVLRAEGRPVRAEIQCYCDRVVQALLADLVRAKHHVPGALCDGSGEVPGGSLRGADSKVRTEPARPATKTSSANTGPLLVEDADVA